MFSLNSERQLINWILIVVCLFVSMTVLLPEISVADQNEIYYIRSDIKTVNGEIVETSLLMVPAEEEFRIKKFTLYAISGMAQQTSDPDMISAAEHNALSNLLLAHGIKSVNHKSINNKNNHHDESVLSYEGFIKTPYSVLSKDFNNSEKIYSVKMNVYFAPIAYPSEWSFYYYKKKLYDLLNNMVSVFW